MDWNKYKPYFTEKEIACKCGCGMSSISEELMDKVLLARIHYHKPMVITSGCRCAKHNKAVGGKADSAHTKGYALDIVFTNTTELFYMMDSIINAGIKRIGINFDKKFIHVDVDNSKVTPCMFPY